ncbi:MAG: hypothetical protein KDA66_05820 [Planctomycetaceae bacterium]|nr:hypothetical protein [Planctomycetaceae bacterium]
MSAENPPVRSRRRWFYLLAVLMIGCVLGIAVWKWTRPSAAFDLTGSWLVSDLRPATSRDRIVTFLPNGDFQDDTGTPGKWWMVGNEIHVKYWSSGSGTTWATLFPHSDTMVLIAEQNPETGEVILSATGTRPFATMKRTDD